MLIAGERHLHPVLGVRDAQAILSALSPVSQGRRFVRPAGWSTVGRTVRGRNRPKELIPG
jgi:hypothetical protein